MLGSSRIGDLEYPSHGGVGAHALALAGMALGAYWMTHDRPTVGGVVFVGSPVLMHYLGLRKEGYVK